MSHGRNKNMRKLYSQRDRVNKKKLELEYCKTEMQNADIFAKPLKSNTNYEDYFDIIKSIIHNC